MGMTDKQFNTLLRFLLDALEDVDHEEDAEKKASKLRRVIEHIRDSLED